MNHYINIYGSIWCRFSHGILDQLAIDLQSPKPTIYRMQLMKALEKTVSKRSIVSMDGV